MNQKEKKKLSNIFLYISYNYLKISHSKIRETIRMYERISEKLDLSDILMKELHIDDRLLRECVDLIKAELLYREMDYCTYFDDDYPTLLSDIFDYPLVLYLRGCRERLLDKDKVSIIGTRKPSYDGTKMCDKVVEHVSRLNYTVISGLAFGIDLLSHKACLKYNTPAIAVLASSVDLITPRSNTKTAKELIQSGNLIISEYPPNTSSKPVNFVLRNRIITGLSMKTFVIEGGIKSGSLTTAKHAISQNRELYVMPGSISNPSCAGTNILLKEGANVVLEPNDFVYIEDKKDEIKLIDNDIYDIIRENIEISIYDLMKISKLEFVDLMPILSELELGRFIRIDVDKVMLS